MQANSSSQHCWESQASQLASIVTSHAQQGWHRSQHGKCYAHKAYPIHLHVLVSILIWGEYSVQYWYISYMISGNTLLSLECTFCITFQKPLSSIMCQLLCTLSCKLIPKAHLQHYRMQINLLGSRFKKNHLKSKNDLQHGKDNGCHVN